jgi:hypothetical protein
VTPAARQKASPGPRNEQAAEKQGPRRRRRVRRSGPPGPPPPFDAALVSRLAHNVEIVSVDLIGAHFSRQDDGALPAAVGGDLVPDAAIAVEWAIDDDEHILGCLITFGTFFENRREPYRVVAKFRVIYEVNPEIRPNTKEINQFAHWNAMFNVWPYWREYLATMIGRAHLPNFVAPVMAVPIPQSAG